MLKTVSTTLPIASAFTGFFLSIFAYSELEKGIREMETSIYGSPQSKQNTTVSIVLGIVLILLSLPTAGIAGLVFCFGLWLYSCRQRDRLLRLARELDVSVIDIRGGPIAIGGSWIFFTLFFAFVIVFGPLVRQYRTIKMYNELVYEFNRQ